MTNQAEYLPPKIWTWSQENGGAWASINRPVSGATHEKALPIGRHPLQLYSLGTPNGVKVTVMLEELLALGHAGAEYDAWLIKIGDGDQFSSGFVSVNPNSKIPALLDRGGSAGLSAFLHPPAGYRTAQKMSSDAMNRRASSMGRTVRPSGPALVQRSFHSDQ
jgi:GST-like protein